MKLTAVLLAMLTLSMSVPPAAAEVEAEAAVCPAPRTVLLVRCPGAHEITGMTTSCRQKKHIDECAIGA